jgi:transposase
MEEGYFWLSSGSVRADRAASADGHTREPRVDDRRVISGIVHVLMSGCRWKDAPSAYGPRKTLYNRFQRWAVRTRSPRPISQGRLFG